MPSGELLKGCNRRTTNLRPPLAVRSCQKKGGEKEEGTEEREREEKGRTEYKKTACFLATPWLHFSVKCLYDF